MFLSRNLLSGTDGKVSVFERGDCPRPEPQESRTCHEQEEVIRRGYDPRIHITALEAGTQCPSMNVVFYLSEALDMKPDVFVREVMEEIECFKSKERERTHGIRR